MLLFPRPFCLERTIERKTETRVESKENKSFDKSRSTDKKYDEKDIYTATLIPDYGSWIHFGFQKNTKINSYKYPLKNQEDEIIIQLNEKISLWDAESGCPFKAVSFSGEITKKENGLLHWEMIIDV